MPTSRTPLQVLILEDNEERSDLLIRELTAHGFDVEATVVAGREEFLQELPHGHDLILAAAHASGLGALEVLTLLRDRGNSLPLVVVGAPSDEEEVVECIRAGAWDYLSWQRLDRLGNSVEACLEERSRRQEPGEVDGSRDGDEPGFGDASRPPLAGIGANGVGSPHGEPGAGSAPMRDGELSRIAALHQVARTTLGNTDLRSVLSLVADKAVEVLDARAAGLWVLERSNGVLVRYAARNLPVLVPGKAEVRLGEEAVGRCGLERRRVRIEGGEEIAREALRGEACDFREYLAVPLEAMGQLQGVLEVFCERERTFEREWLEFLERLATEAGAAIHHAMLIRRLERSEIELAVACDETIEGWARALDLRDHEGVGHSRRVADLTLALARRLDVSGDELARMRRGALLHDVGKMGVPDAILAKPGQLDAQERNAMQRHPELALDLLRSIPFLAEAVDIPYCHHENWDGSGYPRGLSGEEIPLAARIFAVADVFDALTSDRPYRNAWSAEAARRFIEERSGTQFDPSVVEAFGEALLELTIGE